MNREHVIVEWVSIQSTNVRYIQVSDKKINRINFALTFWRIISVHYLRYHKKFARGEKETLGSVAGHFLVRTIVMVFDWSADKDWSYHPDHYLS